MTNGWSLSRCVSTRPRRSVYRDGNADDVTVAFAFFWEQYPAYLTGDMKEIDVYTM